MDIQLIKKELIEQMKTHFKGNIYHWTQVSFSYHSNKIEGSRLTEEQTEMIFETNSFITKANEAIQMDDLIESMNHFKLFDYMLKHIDDPISIPMIIEMNTILKRNTSDEANPRYNIGGFKIIPNMIGFINAIHTTAPENVEKEINELIQNYNNNSYISFDDILDFHIEFEKIHPFADGNGRVGRMIMFKECLKNNIMPFIILDKYKDFYLRNLKETCLHCQDIYETMCQSLLNFNINKK
ncbi:Fic family protein [Longibaculum muris]|uniref:Fic family protein n=1 Tax=Longibaculum muris TaxID=1796628 RepID=UPI0012BA2FF2|nr:Fic family protein [Longibaculum muris]